MRAFDRDLIRGGHYGQRSCEPHLKAEHTGAPTNAANVKKSSCHLGAVHTRGLKISVCSSVSAPSVVSQIRSGKRLPRQTPRGYACPGYAGPQRPRPYFQSMAPHRSARSWRAPDRRQGAVRSDFDHWRCAGGRMSAFVITIVVRQLLLASSVHNFWGAVRAFFHEPATDTRRRFDPLRAFEWKIASRECLKGANVRNERPGIDGPV